MLVLGMTKRVLRHAHNGSSRIDKKLAKKLLNGEDYISLFKSNNF